jgi:hypothetical protein
LNWKPSFRRLERTNGPDRRRQLPPSTRHTLDRLTPARSAISFAAHRALLAVPRSPPRAVEPTADCRPIVSRHIDEENATRHHVLVAGLELALRWSKTKRRNQRRRPNGSHPRMSVIRVLIPAAALVLSISTASRRIAWSCGALTAKFSAGTAPRRPRPAAGLIRASRFRPARTCRISGLTGIRSIARRNRP